MSHRSVLSELTIKQKQKKKSWVQRLGGKLVKKKAVNVQRRTFKDLQKAQKTAAQDHLKMKLQEGLCP